jgi:hypothetical protein
LRIEQDGRRPQLIGRHDLPLRDQPGWPEEGLGQSAYSAATRVQATRAVGTACIGPPQAESPSRNPVGGMNDFSRRERPFAETVLRTYPIDFTKSAISDRSSSSDGMSISRAT